jgi:hypothetical protein
MTHKKLVDSLFFNPKENPFKEKKATLNLDMVEATINQITAEINEQRISNKDVIKTFKRKKQEKDLAYAEGFNNGLKATLLMLRRLKSDILWKQLTLNNNENE